MFKLHVSSDTRRKEFRLKVIYIDAFISIPLAILIYAVHIKSATPHSRQSPCPSLHVRVPCCIQETLFCIKIKRSHRPIIRCLWRRYIHFSHQAQSLTLQCASLGIYMHTPSLGRRIIHLHLANILVDFRLWIRGRIFIHDVVVAASCGHHEGRKTCQPIKLLVHNSTF